MDWQATDAVLLFQPDCALRPHLLHGPSWIHSPPWCWRKTHTRSSALSFLFQSNSSWLFRTWEEPSLDFQRPFQFVLLSHTFWITWSHPHGCYHHHHPSTFSQMESHSPLRLHLTVFFSKIKISATLVSDNCYIFTNIHLSGCQIFRNWTKYFIFCLSSFIFQAWPWCCQWLSSWAWWFIFLLILNSERYKKILKTVSNLKSSLYVSKPVPMTRFLCWTTKERRRRQSCAKIQ